ncbi:hypothetical protein ACSAMZ_15110 [Xanthomonas citri pv. bilvae]|uniref:hypothetical protein n=1 Tax=Xanthomonas citri TaxID=346 RepID=UPI0005444DF7|nr:conserved hypothetical protein [Xanthomonas citri pv. bilvae]
MAALKWMVYARSPSLDTFWDDALKLGRVPATDYRARGPQHEPEVVYFDRWEGLVPTWRAASFEAFFAVLRQAGLDV